MTLTLCTDYANLTLPVIIANRFFFFTRVVCAEHNTNMTKRWTASDGGDNFKKIRLVQWHHHRGHEENHFARSGQEKNGEGFI